MTGAAPVRVRFDVSRIAERLASAKIHGAAFPMLFRELLRQLTTGHPVATHSLARALDWSIPAVIETLARAQGVEYDTQGDVVGYGLTLREPPHEFEINDQRLFTWCALDTLFFPALLAMSARISSTCAVTGAAVRMTVSPHEVSEVTPSEAMLSLVQPRGADGIRRSFCRHVRFIASRGAARQWEATHPEIVVVSVVDGFRVGQEVARRM
jgi:alkylmercury lyase